MRIVIADDHPLYLDAVRQQVGRAFPDAEVHVACSLDGVLDLLAAARADLVMLDFAMPGMDGVAGIRRVVEAADGTPVMVMSGVAYDTDVRACIEAGARGFVPKTLEGGLFVAAVTMVARGGSFVPAEVMALAPLPPSPAIVPDAFSERERAVLRMVAGGSSNKEIARAFELQEVTVKFYLTRIFQKMGVKNRSHAAALAVQSGLIGEP